MVSSLKTRLPKSSGRCKVVLIIVSSSISCLPKAFGRLDVFQLVEKRLIERKDTLPGFLSNYLPSRYREVYRFMIPLC